MAYDSCSQTQTARSAAAVDIVPSANSNATPIDSRLPIALAVDPDWDSKAADTQGLVGLRVLQEHRQEVASGGQALGVYGHAVRVRDGDPALGLGA